MGGDIVEIVVVGFVRSVENVVDGTNDADAGKLLTGVIAVHLRVSWRHFGFVAECHKFSDLSCCCSDLMVRDQSC